MKTVARGLGFDLRMTHDEYDHVSERGKKVMKADTIGVVDDNHIMVFSYFGHYGIQMALEVARYYGLVVED